MGLNDNFHKYYPNFHGSHRGLFPWESKYSFHRSTSDFRGELAKNRLPQKLSSMEVCTTRILSLDEDPE